MVRRSVNTPTDCHWKRIWVGHLAARLFCGCPSTERELRDSSRKRPDKKFADMKVAIEERLKTICMPWWMNLSMCFVFEALPFCVG